MAGKRGTFSHVKMIAEKKSQVRNLVENFQTMDESDIMNSPVSGWIKKVVLQEKEKIKEKQQILENKERFLKENDIKMGEEMSPEEIAEKMTNYTQNYDNKYPYGNYHGPTVTLGKTILIDIDEGPLLYMDNNWIKTPYGAYSVDKEVYNRMMMDTEIKELVTPKEFSVIINEYLGIKFD